MGLSLTAGCSVSEARVELRVSPYFIISEQMGHRQTGRK